MKIKNAEQLEDAIYGALESVKVERAYIAQAQEVGNLAGKIINLAKRRLEYAELKKKLGNEAPRIRALEDA